MTGPISAVETLGWVATAVFVGSYFCARAEALKRVQMLGALLWVGYGLLSQAPPVVAANLLVFGAAAWTGGKERRHADTVSPR
ncbi:MAG TPA: hypothetical protein VMR21_03160 [Vicinamibacteria bacterium]|nr:hypothetical protein [Vicinamibacteria bacterium]